MLILNPPRKAAKKSFDPSPVLLGRITIQQIIHRFRKVPLSYSGHVRGFHPVREGHDMIEWEGLTERDTISWLASYQELIRIESQPLTIFYGFNGERHRYTPDFAVHLAEVPFALECLGFGPVTYVECKPAWRVPLERVNLDRNFRAARLALRQPMVLITDEDCSAGIQGNRHDY